RFLLGNDFDDVNTELCLNEIADRARTEAEGDVIEFRHHLAASKRSEIAAGNLRGFILRELFRESCEILAFLGAVQNTASFVLDRLDFLGALSLSLEQNVLRGYAFGKVVFGLVLVVVLLQVIVADRDETALLYGIEIDVAGLPFFRHVVLGFVLLVI